MSEGSSEEDETVTALAGDKSLWTAQVSARSAEQLELASRTGTHRERADRLHAP